VSAWVRYSMKICKVLLDTSAFLLVAEGIDLLDELNRVLECEGIELYTLQEVVKELRNIADSRASRKSPAATIALDYIFRKNKVKVIPSDVEFHTADKAIIDFTKANNDFIVVTLDRRLKKALKSMNVKVLTWWYSRRRFSRA